MSIVHNTTKRLLVIPAAGVIEGTPQTDRVAMKPGFNKVDDDVLTHALGLEDESTTNPTVKQWFDLGWLKLEERHAELPIPKTLEGVNAKDSIVFVKRVTDVSVLRVWLDDELRDDVRDALKRRLVDMGDDGE